MSSPTHDLKHQLRVGTVDDFVLLPKHHTYLGTFLHVLGPHK